MSLLDWFGSKKKEDPPAVEAVREELDELRMFSGLRAEVTTREGNLLFVAKLVGLRGITGELQQFTDATAALPQPAEGEEPTPLPVNIRGYSEKYRKAAHLEAVITPKPHRVWQAEQIRVIKTSNDRAFFRIDLDLSAVAAPIGRPGLAEEECRLLNVSVGGVRFRSKAPHYTGDKLLLKAQFLPDRDPSLMFCQVLRVIEPEKGDTEYGCKFIELNEADEDKILQIIFDLQRKKKSGS